MSVLLLPSDVVAFIEMKTVGQVKRHVVSTGALILYLQNRGQHIPHRFDGLANSGGAGSYKDHLFHQVVDGSLKYRSGIADGSGEQVPWA